MTQPAESTPPTPAYATGTLRALQAEHGATFLAYGPPAPPVPSVPPVPPAIPAAPPVAAPMSVEVVETFGEYESEYAAIRKGVAILDQPQRGLVEVQGADRLAFLHRMLTHDTRSLAPAPGPARRAFLLGKTGRIMADMIVIHQEERTLLDLDVFQATKLPAELEKYVFTEDVRFGDRSADWAQVALHGPASAALLGALGATGCAELEVMQHRTITLAGKACTVYRRDETGAPGLHLLLPRIALLDIYQALAAAVGGLTPDVEGGVIRPIRGRGIGWAAYNTARIEGGTPLFCIDFGPDSLPHETGVLQDAVSFTKGCYLGQEVVARMHNLGHPKRVLVGLRCGDDRMPISGAQVFEAPAPEAPGSAPASGDRQVANTGKLIGAVSSSTISPMLGGIAVGFATVKWGSHVPGTVVGVPAEGQIVPATVQPLGFLPAPTPGGAPGGIPGMNPPRADLGKNRT